MTNSSQQSAQASLPDSYFENLAESGFDFLLRAAKLLPHDPKFSLVCSSIGIELILKARLLREHWSLVLDKPGEADRALFLKGAFRSVSIEGAIQRLERVCGLYFDPTQKKALRALQETRNRVVHFVHDAFTTDSAPSEATTILAEQLRAWFYMQTLTLDHWAEDFAQFSPKRAEIEIAFRNLRAYLQVRFDGLANALNALKVSGIRVDECPSCGFQAMSVRGDGTRREGECRVCGLGDLWLEFACPHCSKQTQFHEIVDATCDECESKIELSDLVGKGGQFEVDENAKEGVAYCMTCEFAKAKSVVGKDGQFICLSCLSTQSRVGTCGYCGEDIAPDEPETSVFGCLMCGGMGI